MTAMAGLDLMPRLDKAHQAVLRATPPEFLDLSDIPAMRRKFIDVMARIERPPRPEGLEITDHRPSDDVMVRLYRPAGLETPAPALYWIHGGGLVMGTVEMDDDYCAGLAHRLRIVVASVDYRLSPDFAYPTPLEDCYTGLRWLHDNAAGLGVEAGRIAIGGASGGGALCAGLGLLARDRGEVPVCYQFLVFPMLDDRNETAMSHAVLDPRVWNRTANLIGWNAYLEGRAGAADIPFHASASRAEVDDLVGLPPTYINVGDLDLFVDEDVEYARRLRLAGVPVELHVYPGAFHGSNNSVSRSDLSRRWKADERAALHRALHGREMAT
jgi:acetyl esterase/lipase